MYLRLGNRKFNGYYCCPIIVVTFSVGNRYAHGAAIMGHSIFNSHLEAYYINYYIFSYIKLL